MITTAFDMDQFVRDAGSFARLVGPAEIFGRSKRSVRIPPSCIALAWTDSPMPTVVKGGGLLEADVLREAFLVKSTPAAINYRISRLPSKDDYEFAAEIWISVQAVPERTELGLLRRELLGQNNRAIVSDLSRHCEEVIREAISKFVRSREAEVLESPRCWTQFDSIMADAFAPLGFSSGMTLASDVRLSLKSPEFEESKRVTAAEAERARRNEAENARHATAAEARRRDMEELISLVERAKSTGDAGGFLKSIQLLDVGRRAEIYSGLMGLAAESVATQSILVVAGQQLIWFDPRHAEAPTRKLELPDSLGPLRSLRFSGDRKTALIGARTGVHVVHVADGTGNAYSLQAAQTPRGGVNAVAMTGERIYATHSEVGLTCWLVGELNAPRRWLQASTQAAKSVRDVQSRDGLIWFTAGAHVIAWDGVDESSRHLYEAADTIQSLMVADGRVFAGLDNGAIVCWPIGEPTNLVEIRRPNGRPVHSLEWLAGGGAPRLLIAEGEPHLTLQVLDDPYRAEYRWRRGLRWGFAADDFIVGVDESRDRLVLWRADDPHEPIATVSIGQLTGQPIQDVGILPCV